VSLLEICTIKIFTANGGCTLTSAECRYSVRIWLARICSGLGFIGQISKRHHFAAQSLRSVTQPAQIFEELIFGVFTLSSRDWFAPKPNSSADFTNALVNEASDIPEIKVFGERRL
jgi:hypothetical protein